jgi:dUTP pyrophosphatase
MPAMPPIRVRLLRLTSPDLVLPAYHSDAAAGMDLAAAVEHPIVLAPGAFEAVPCGFAIALPAGYEAQVRPRSGLASRHGVTVLNAPGTIDSDYRGEIKVILVNHGPEPFTITKGLRIAQLVVAPVARVEWEVAEALPATGRGAGGFGHTGT